MKKGRKAGALFLICISLAAVSCARQTDVLALSPPSTPPLSRDVLGYGVVRSSYIHVYNEPAEGAVSLGSLRRSSLVEILERKTLKQNGKPESWVLVEGSYQGWLRENTLEVFPTKAQAETAAETMAQ